MDTNKHELQQGARGTEPTRARHFPKMNSISMIAGNCAILWKESAWDILWIVVVRFLERLMSSLFLKTPPGANPGWTNGGGMLVHGRQSRFGRDGAAMSVPWTAVGIRIESGVDAALQTLRVRWHVSRALASAATGWWEWPGGGTEGDFTLIADGTDEGNQLNGAGDLCAMRGRGEATRTWMIVWLEGLLAGCVNVDHAPGRKLTSRFALWR